MTSSRPQRKRRARVATGVTLTVVCVLLAIWAVVVGRHRIHAAARRGDLATVAKLLSCGWNPDKRHLLRNSTPLIEAAQGGHLDVVILLVEHGADVNEHGDTFQRPLHFAASAGHAGIVKFLLQQGAETNKALHEAARTGQLEVARILLDHGAEINQKGVDEATPLETAASSGKAAMAEFLLARGAGVNSQGIYGRTPLHVAAWNDDLAMGKILLEHGADPTLQYNGQSVLPRSEEFRTLLEQYEAARPSD